MKDLQSMARFVVPGCLVAICLGIAGTAAAQDKPSGPYLRLDTGASFTTAAHRDFGNLSLGDSYVVGGGVGYRFMPELRVDVTLGYRGDYGFNRPGGPVAVHADLESVVGLASAYYDIITIGGFTPYVGAGIGFADNHSHTRRTPVSDIARAASTKGPGLGPSDDTSTDFAWQATAGVSYSITTNWSLDFGYRYVDMGTVKSASSVAAGGASTFITGSAASGLAAGGPFANTTMKGDLQAHEVAIGLRYSF